MTKSPMLDLDSESIFMLLGNHYTKKVNFTTGIYNIYKVILLYFAGIDSCDNLQVLASTRLVIRGIKMRIKIGD